MTAVPSLLERLVREPLLHFFVIGAVLFAIDASRNDDGRIVVSPATMKLVVDNHVSRTGEPPDDATRLGLAREWAREEALVREARALGLDRSDRVVRRRLAQAVRLLLEDAQDPDEPTDGELRQFVASHPERYASPARFSFTHVFFVNRAGAEQRAKQALSELRRGSADPRELGDPFVTGPRFLRVSNDQIRLELGARFAAELATAPGGQWVGPLPSEFGWHVVRVDSREPAGHVSAQALDAARDDLRGERIVAGARQAETEILDSYEVVVEAP